MPKLWHVWRAGTPPQIRCAKMLACLTRRHAAANQVCQNFGTAGTPARCHELACQNAGTPSTPPSSRAPGMQDFWQTPPQAACQRANCASILASPAFWRLPAAAPSSSRARLPKPGPMTYGEAKAGGPAKPRWCPTDTEGLITASHR